MSEEKKLLYKKTLLLAVPIMIQQGITNAVGLVDNLMVGSLGEEAITAVSIAGQLMFVFNLAIFGALSGPGIYGAQYYGNGDTEGVRGVFRIKLWVTAICATIGIVVFLNFDTFLLGLYMKGSASQIDPVKTMELAKQYLRIMILGIPFFALTQVYSTSLRETNESMKPMLSGIVSVVADIVLNYLLIFGKFGFPKLGVAGAAYATVASRVAEFLVIVIWSHLSTKKHIFLKGMFKTLLVPRKMITPIIKKSTPILMNEFLWAGAIAVITTNYSVRGLNVLTAMNISNAICNLLNVVFIALGHAVGIIIGQMLGAGEFEKAKRSSVSLMWFTAIVCALISIMLIALSGVFPKFYKTDESIRHMASKFIFITALFFPVQGFLNSLYFTLRSGGKTLVTFLFDSVFSWTMCVTVSFALAHYTGLNIYTIYIIVQALDIIKVVIGYVMIKKGIWISNLVT